MGTIAIAQPSGNNKFPIKDLKGHTCRVHATGEQYNQGGVSGYSYLVTCYYDGSVIKTFRVNGMGSSGSSSFKVSSGNRTAGSYELIAYMDGQYTTSYTHRNRIVLNGQTLKTTNWVGSASAVDTGTITIP